MIGTICLTENMEDSAEENEDSEKEEEKEGKRGITYQIAKNKGLTPHRKKENRNPRVKHRNKFRKAKIRRKGQVTIVILYFNINYEEVRGSYIFVCILSLFVTQYIRYTTLNRNRIVIDKTLTYMIYAY